MGTPTTTKWCALSLGTDVYGDPISLDSGAIVRVPYSALPKEIFDDGLVHSYLRVFAGSYEQCAVDTQYEWDCFYVRLAASGTTIMCQGSDTPDDYDDDYGREEMWRGTMFIRNPPTSNLNSVTVAWSRADVAPVTDRVGISVLSDHGDGTLRTTYSATSDPFAVTFVAPSWPLPTSPNEANDAIAVGVKAFSGWKWGVGSQRDPDDPTRLVPTYTWGEGTTGAWTTGPGVVALGPSEPIIHGPVHVTISAGSIYLNGRLSYTGIPGSASSLFGTVHYPLGSTDMRLYNGPTDSPTGIRTEVNALLGTWESAPFPAPMNTSTRWFLGSTLGWVTVRPLESLGTTEEHRGFPVYSSAVPNFPYYDTVTGEFDTDPTHYRIFPPVPAEFQCEDPASIFFLADRLSPDHDNNFYVQYDPRWTDDDTEVQGNPGEYWPGGSEEAWADYGAVWHFLPPPYPLGPYDPMADSTGTYTGSIALQSAADPPVLPDSTFDANAVAWGYTDIGPAAPLWTGPGENWLHPTMRGFTLIADLDEPGLILSVYQGEPPFNASDDLTLHVDDDGYVVLTMFGASGASREISSANTYSTAGYHHITVAYIPEESSTYLDPSGNHWPSWGYTPTGWSTWQPATPDTMHQMSRVVMYIDGQLEVDRTVPESLWPRLDGVGLAFSITPEYTPPPPPLPGTARCVHWSVWYTGRVDELWMRTSTDPISAAFAKALYMNASDESAFTQPSAHPTPAPWPDPPWVPPGFLT